MRKADWRIASAGPLADLFSDAMPLLRCEIGSEWQTDMATIRS